MSLLGSLKKIFMSDNNKQQTLRKNSINQLNILKIRKTIKNKRHFKKKYRNIDISVIVKNDIRFTHKYNIIKTIYERIDKAVYIVKAVDDCEYLVKIKKPTKQNNDEMYIYELLKNKRNNYVIKFIEHVAYTNYQYFVYEYFNGKTLGEYLIDNQNIISETDIKEIFIKIVNAVKFLHKHNIIHCDLKLDNILIDNNKNIKIIDFDLSRICENDIITNNVFGTIQYIAPESYDLCIYSKKSDVWGLGIILYILITKKFPYNDTTNINTHDNMYRRNEFKHPNVAEVECKIKEQNYNKNIVTLIEMMLKFEDDERINVDDILKFQW